MRSAAVANAQAPLEQGSGGFAEFDYQANGIVEKRIVVVGRDFSRVVGALGGWLAIFLRRLQEFLLILRLALCLPEFDHGCDFFLGHVGSMQSMHARRP